MVVEEKGGTEVGGIVEAEEMVEEGEEMGEGEGVMVEAEEMGEGEV